MELSSMSQRRRLSSAKISRDFSIATKIEKQYKFGKSFQGWQRGDILLSRGGTCHPMPPNGYKPA